jgi:transcriptional regulator with XRE-family HTH domain
MKSEGVPIVMTVQVANKLVELRRKHGYSQEKLAEMLGISRQAVSKWERAEASPDTDNLVMLSKLYGISLDDLLQIELEEDAEQSGTADGQEKNKEEKSTKKSGKRETHVDIGLNGIHVVDEDEVVHVGWKGIHVENAKGEKVHVSGKGIYVDDGVDHYVGKRGRVVVNGVDYTDKQARRRDFFERVPVAIVVLIAVIIISFFQGSMHPAWMLFLAIPIVSSLFTAIRKRDAHQFAYPILMLLVFFCLGFFYDLWHPGWVAFLTVPIYYSVLPRRSKSVDVNFQLEDTDADQEFAEETEDSR